VTLPRRAAALQAHLRACSRCATPWAAIWALQDEVGPTREPTEAELELFDRIVGMFCERGRRLYRMGIVEHVVARGRRS
jgi:hypothetical protein